MTLKNDFYIHAHIKKDDASSRVLTGHKHIFILRHPRNVAISWMRHRSRQNPDIIENSQTLAKLISGGMFGMSVPKHYEHHLMWLDDESVLSVRFENLTSPDHGEWQKIYKYLDKEFAEHSNFTLGNSATSTGQHSDWLSSPYWDADVEESWRSAGGLNVEERAGYA